MTDPRQADDFLQRYHRQHAGVTARAFAHGRIDVGIDGGGSSYDLLAATVPAEHLATATVLDLGCGDGYLQETLIQRGLPPRRALGLDMSSAELHQARERLPATVPLIHARAQALPLQDASVDHALSHLAFMLMSDIDAVVAELARVIRPGGQFATVIGGGPRIGDTFELFVDLLVALHRELGIAPVIIGDPRMYQVRGLEQVFAPGAGFALVHMQDCYVDLGGSFERVWSTLATMYPVFSLPEDALATLRTRFAEAAKPLLTGDRLPCSMFIRLARYQRA